MRGGGPAQMAVPQVGVKRASLSASLCLSPPPPGGRLALVRTCVWVNTAGQTVPLRAPPPHHKQPLQPPSASQRAAPESFCAASKFREEAPQEEPERENGMS